MASDRRTPHLVRVIELWKVFPSRKRSVAFGALFAGATFAAGALGARSSSARSPWYRALEKPAWQPPPAAFGPVWTALYALTAASGWRTWRSSAPARRRALALWGAQLALNAAWSPLFFGLRRPRAALVDAALLVPVIGAYALAARRADRLAATLILPYLGWSAFALALNSEIVRRNRKMLARR
jgi:translocator protein